MSLCFSDGKIMPLNEAGVSLTDLGLQRGYAVFDFLRTYNGKPFLFDEHLERFKNSAKMLYLEIPYTDVEIRDISNELLIRNKFEESNIKFMLTGGSEADHHANFYVVVTELIRLPETVYSKGVKVLTYEHERYFPEAKTTNYVTALSLKKWQNSEGAFEILYTSKGRVLEGTTSNFFIIQNDKLVTPNEDILFGMTRNFVIKIAREHFDVEEREINTEELGLASEAFIASTNKEIVPVVNIDGQKVGDGTVGGKTKELMEVFRNYTLNHSVNLI